MKEYLKAQNRANKTILENVYSSDELDRFSKSDYRWADNRAKPFRHKGAKASDWCKAEASLCSSDFFL